MSNLFISHSSRDADAAEELKARLAQQGHRSVFLDLDPDAGIQAGVSWERTLYTKLRACRAVVALCSDSYLRSQWCFAEIALARMEGKEIFALQIEPWGDALEMPSILTEDQFIDLRADIEEGYRRLFKGFNVKGIVPSEQRDWRPNDPPYPGLRAFHVEDAPIFFGRDAEILECTELLNQLVRQGHPRLAMVLGSSGSGKSSLVRAGIVPQLLRDKKSWTLVPVFRPGIAPLRELCVALSHAFDECDQALAWQDIYRSLEDSSEHGDAGSLLETPSPMTLDAAREKLFQALNIIEGELGSAGEQMMESVRRLRSYLDEKTQQSGSDVPPLEANALVAIGRRLGLAARAPDAPVVLIIDQFEELLGHDKDHPATRFLAMLRAAMEVESSPFLVVGTMRSDFLGPLQAAPALQGLGRKTISVGPMSRHGMRQVIEEPAKLGQIQLQAGLADILLDETGTSDALPLLAFTLRLLWDRHHDKRLLEISHYEKLGGLQGAIARVAEETYQTALDRQSDDSERDRVAREIRDAFLAMVRPAAEGAGWSRNPVEWSQLSPGVRPLLEPFIDPQRLLVKRKDGSVEVAHEALFRSWGTLRQWLDQNAEALHLLQEIQLEAAKWHKSAEASKGEYLWTGGRLARAQELRDNGVLSVEDLDLNFIDASSDAERAAAEAEEARRQRELRQTRLFAGVVLAAFIVSVVLGLWAWRERNRAEQQTHVAERSFKMSLIERYARNFAYGPMISRELSDPMNGWNAIVADQIRVRSPKLHWLEDQPTDVDQEVEWVAYGPEGIFATAHADKKIWLWRPTGDGDHRAALLGESDERLWDLRISASGEFVATSDGAGVVKLWRTDAQYPQPPQRILKPDRAGDALRVRIDNDASVVAVLQEYGWRGERSVTIWDLSQDQPRSQRLDEVSETKSLAVSPNGALLLLGDRQGGVYLRRINSDAEPVALPPGTKQLDSILEAAFDESGDTAVVVDYEGLITQWQLAQPNSPPSQRSTYISPIKLRVIEGQIFVAGKHTVSILNVDESTDTKPFFPEFYDTALLDIDFNGHRLLTALKEVNGAWTWSVDAPENPKVLSLAAAEKDSAARDAVYLDDQTLLVAYACGTLRRWTDIASDRQGTIKDSHAPENFPQALHRPDCNWNASAKSYAPLQALSVGGDKNKRYAMAFHDGRIAIGEFNDRGDPGRPRWIPAPAAAIESLSTDKRCANPIRESTIEQNAAWSIAFDPRAEKLVAGYQDGHIRVLDMATLKWSHVLEHSESPVCAVDWSTQSQQFLSGSLDGTAVLWRQASDGSFEQAGHYKTYGGINTLAFDPGGDSFFTAGQSQYLELWSTTQPGKRIQVVERYGAPIYSAHFGPEGDRIISGTANTLNTQCLNVDDRSTTGACKVDQKPVSITIPNRNRDTRVVSAIALANNAAQFAAIDVSGEISLSRTDPGIALWQQQPQCLPIQERQRIFFEDALQARAGFEQCKQTTAKCQSSKQLCQSTLAQ